LHPGLDISTDRGRPVVATADGVVKTAEWNGNYGNLLVIDHGFGITTRYGHLSAPPGGSPGLGGCRRLRRRDGSDDGAHLLRDSRERASSSIRSGF
jgi:hypothetical protein